MPPESKTNGISSCAFKAAVPKCRCHGHSWYDVSNGCLPKDAQQGLELLTEEVYFLTHSIVDVIFVFSMMDKLSFLLHCEGDMPSFVFGDP